MIDKEKSIKSFLKVLTDIQNGCDDVVFEIYYRNGERVEVSAELKEKKSVLSLVTSKDEED